MKLKPATEALAYRIWAYAKPLGWDCTVVEIAEALGASTSAVANTCHRKGWIPRLRAGSADVARSRRIDGPSGGLGMAGIEVLVDMIDG